MLRRMADAMAHRGPDGEGYAVGSAFGMAFRRLAVVDRDAGDQPMWSPDDRCVITYNGQIHNHRRLREELTALGHTFATGSDTEVVLAAWRQWGAEAFDRFTGMFALAIADKESGEVTLARDPFGIKPLYLARGTGDQVVWGSEFRAILASHLVPRRPDDATIHRYLRYRVHDDTEATFFAGITRIMPGEMATVGPTGEVRRRTYTNLYTELSELATKPVARYDAGQAARFGTELERIIRSRLVADVPVGTALSGGLDSSTVVCVTDRLLAAGLAEAADVDGRQQTFSAVFPGERNDEEGYVDAVAEQCGDRLSVHKVRPSADRFLVDLHDFVRTQEEPVISTGPYAQYCVMREASRHVSVMIDGQGADEMMAGYVPYYLVHLRQLWRSGRRVRAVTELARSLDVLWRWGRFAVADRLRRRAGIPVERLLNARFAQRYAGQPFDVVTDNLKARLADDIFRHSLPALLRYEDRNTMRFSMEGRVAFLDADLLRFLWRMDDSAIIHAGWNKRVLRDATRFRIPRLINRRRNKIGFTTPEEAWFRRIKNSVYEILASPSFGRRPYFNQSAVLDAFKSYLAGQSSAETMTFWRMINVELWLRLFVDVDPFEAEIEDLEEDYHQPGMHAPAPPKSDYVPNDGKGLVTSDGGWARFPLRCDLVSDGDDVAELAKDRVTEFFAALPEAPPDARRLVDDGGRWFLFVSEKIVAVSQGRSFFTWQIRPGWWARQLSRRVVRTPYGIGLGDPTTMQLAIGEAGLPRILTAAAVSVVGKLLGRRGDFYRVAGARVRAIDGPTEYSAYPANVSAKLAPTDPAGVARRISAVLRAGLPADAVDGFGGTVIIDANDIGCDVLGHDTGRNEADLVAAVADNPLGQGREQTPLAVVVAEPRFDRDRRSAGWPVNVERPATGMAAHDQQVADHQQVADRER